jgi:hypothetical protein
MKIWQFSSLAVVYTDNLSIAQLLQIIDRKGIGASRNYSQWRKPEYLITNLLLSPLKIFSLLVLEYS